MSMFPVANFSTSPDVKVLFATTLFDSSVSPLNFFGASTFSLVIVSFSMLSVSVALLINLWIVSSSATKEVVILTRGNMVILEAWLNKAMETPAAASSTGPI